MVRRITRVVIVVAIALALYAQPAAATVRRPQARVTRFRTPIVRRPTIVRVLPDPELGARTVGDLGGDASDVAITFDDGPDPRYTPQVLNVLAAHHVTATFFMVGREAAKFPDLVRQVAAGGNAIGVHTWDHLRLTTASPAVFASQVDRELELVTSLTDVRPTCLRPPYGSANQTTVNEASSRGLSVAQWSVDPRDWTQPGVNAIVNRVTSRLGPNQVILLHDGGGNRSQTVAALSHILDAIEARNLHVVNVCAPTSGGPSSGDPSALLT
jgi:peptidoglycan/xylan/chitin deacetylase (PgdA/CDA1 family)